MQRLNERFGDLAATDWALPLLHRVSRLMEHLESERDHHGKAGLIMLKNTNVHGWEMARVIINCRSVDDGVLLPPGQFAMMASDPSSWDFTIEGNDYRDMVLSVLDQYVHGFRGDWEIKLINEDIEGPSINIATFSPPTYARQVQRHEADLPPRPLRRRLV